jgi:hypothetical protein
LWTTGVIDTDGKFTTGLVLTQMPLLTPVSNLPANSVKPWKDVTPWDVDTGSKLAPVVHLELRNLREFLQKNYVTALSL